jgi:hypothetical protein
MLRHVIAIAIATAYWFRCHGCYKGSDVSLQWLLQLPIGSGVTVATKAQTYHCNSYCNCLLVLASQLYDCKAHTNRHLQQLLQVPMGVHATLRCVQQVAIVCSNSHCKCLLALVYKMLQQPHTSKAIAIAVSYYNTNAIGYWRGCVGATTHLRPPTSHMPRCTHVLGGR